MKKKLKTAIWYISEILKRPHESVFEWNGKIVSKPTYIYYTVKMLWGAMK